MILAYSTAIWLATAALFLIKATSKRLKRKLLALRDSPPVNSTILRRRKGVISAPDIFCSLKFELKNKFIKVTLLP